MAHQRTTSNFTSTSLDSGSTVIGNSNNIKVIARFRPENKLEKQQNGNIIVKHLGDDTCHIEMKDFTGTFTFDRIFPAETEQFEIFEYSLQNTVIDVMNGYNGTVFAYGQTGSGKSYTMMGPNIDETGTRGVTPRIVDQIFNMIEQSSSDIEYMVKVSYMEIYMERIRDLLFPQNDNLPIHEDKTRGVYVKGLTEKYVSSIQEVFNIMKQGDKIKSIASTNMNLESSRSHSIFMIVVSQKNVVTGSQKTGQLFLVDLAGSEKVNKTGASGQTLEEAKKINKSLSTLGMVINALTDGKASHVPYRDSKLTRILQESLGGNSRTSLIINCSPSSFNDLETLSTLRFGARAKNIKNKAKINTELSPLELRQLLRKTQNSLDSHVVYEQKIESELLQWRAGTSPDKAEWIEIGSIGGQATNPPIGSPLLTRSNSALSRPTTPSTPVLNFKRGSVPNISSGKRFPDYPSSPSPILGDSIDDYIRRENDLQDQLAEKESMIERQEQSLKELHVLKSQHEEVNQLKLEFEKLNYEKKELKIKVSSLEELIQELQNGLADAKKELDQKVNQEEHPSLSNSTELDQANFEMKRKRKMTELMGSFLTSTAYKSTSVVLQLIEDINPENLVESKQKLRDAISNLQISSSIDKSDYFKKLLQQTTSEFDSIAMSVDSTEKLRLDELYGRRLQVNDETIASLMNEIDRLCDESNTLRKTVDELQQNGADIKAEASGNIETIQSMQIHISQFETMKKSLMRDLQDRCERIVELEILLDQAHDQYNLALKNSSNKQQEKKVILLQRNLEQLTQVQRKLMDQNSSLKKEVAMSQKLLESRNERIQYLEDSLLASQAKVVKEQEEFEDKLTFLRDRLNEVRNIRQSQSTTRSSGSTGQKIVKPLRGGGAKIMGESPSRGLWERINSYVNS